MDQIIPKSILKDTSTGVINRKEFKVNFKDKPIVHNIEVSKDLDPCYDYTQKQTDVIDDLPTADQINQLSESVLTQNEVSKSKLQKQQSLAHEEVAEKMRSSLNEIKNEHSPAPTATSSHASRIIGVGLKPEKKTELFYI